ncbi:restriction endonuclease subunit S [Idiomarina seosinensis]|uniref:restriction endonuclease subunit S n=1 Tax=Idiomarina seosinensis TaxID=281739 RepID=UPI00384D21E1
MSDIFEKVAELNLDRSGWQLVKFGDVAIQQKKTVDRDNTELTRYVKGEHMYSEDIHLREWGELKDEYLGPAFIRKFEEGDILYGSRRTYLRKVVVAPFDGITSNTTFVIKANEKLIDRRLLPFIMLSEGFTQHSIINSKGSVNPYVNWKDLAGYEFLLPPEAIQAEIVNLLESQGHYFENIKNSLKKVSTYYESLLNDFSSELKSGWSLKPLKDISKINRKTLGSKTPKNYQFRYLDLTSITAPKILGEMKKIKYAEAPSRAKRVVENKSSIIALVRPYQKNIVFIEDAYDVISSTGTAVVVAGDRINSRFLFHQFFSNRFLRFCERMMTGTTYPAITSDDLGLFKVALPNNKDEQDNLAKLLDEVESNISRLHKLEEKIFSLQKSIINQVF